MDKIKIPSGPVPYKNKCQPPVLVDFPEDQLLPVPQSYYFPPVDPQTFVPENYRPALPSSSTHSSSATSNDMEDDKKEEVEVAATIFAPAQHRNLRAELVSMVPSTLIKKRTSVKTARMDTTEQQLQVQEQHQIEEIEDEVFMDDEKVEVAVEQKVEPQSKEKAVKRVINAAPLIDYGSDDDSQDDEIEMPVFKKPKLTINLLDNNNDVGDDDFDPEYEAFKKEMGDLL